MSREFKFRVWDGEKMTDKIELHFAHGLRLVSTSDLGFETIGDDKCILMQYTGLKDRNGVEIYEGDILQGVYQESEGGGWYSEHNVRGKVYFDQYWGVKFDCRDHTQRTAEYWKDISPTKRECRDVEVIGNIYENPELLTNTTEGE